VNEEKKAVQQDRKSGWSRSGITDKKVLLQIPFERTKKQIEGFLEARRCVIERLSEIMASIDATLGTRARINRHVHEIQRFERVLGHSTCQRTLMDDVEYDPALRVVRTTFERTSQYVQQCAAKRTNSNYQLPAKFLNSLPDESTRIRDDQIASVTAKLIREAETRLEMERMLLTKAQHDSSMTALFLLKIFGVSSRWVS
jgi:hypothetical protein